MNINRKQVDDFKKRNIGFDSYRGRKLGGRRSTRDEYTGQRIFMFNKCHSTSKTINVDHVKPVKRVIKEYKARVADGSLSLEDLKTAANRDYNLAVTNEALNKSKGQMTNFEYMLNQAKQGNYVDPMTAVRMMKSQIVADTGIKTELTCKRMGNKFAKMSDSRAVKAVGNEIGKWAPSAGKAAATGVEAGFYTALVGGANLLVHVARGKMSIDKAAGEWVKMTGSSMTIAAATEFIKDQVMTRSSSSILKGVAGQATLVVTVGSSLMQYLNGDMDGVECAINMIGNGLGTLAVAIGSTCAGPAGAVVASVTVGIVQEQIFAYYDSLKTEKLMDEARRKAFEQHIKELDGILDEQRAIIEEYGIREQAAIEYYWDQGFEQVVRSALNDDVDGMTEGLNRIMAYFGEECCFQNIEEFRSFWEDDEAVFRI